MSDDMAPKNERLMIHVEGLQVTLTKRNEQIARLQAKILHLEEGTSTNPEIARAYGRWWRACAERMMSATAAADSSLARIRGEAFQQSMEGERLMRPTADDCEQA